jgi:DNA invertase Pin-like site-specific DNA recombinase
MGIFKKHFIKIGLHKNTSIITHCLNLKKIHQHDFKQHDFKQHYYKIIYHNLIKYYNFKNVTSDITSTLIKTKLLNKLSNDNILIGTNAIIYARVSTLKQNTDKSDSLNTQMGICKYYCKKLNYNVISTFGDILSGNDMLKLKTSEILKYSNIHLIIADPSRLSRNPNQANNFIKKCIEQNITIHFVRDNLKIGNSLNAKDHVKNLKKVVSLIKSAFIETQILKKRIQSTIKIKKELGSFFGKAPFGFDIETYNDQITNIKIRKLIMNNYEQQIIKIIKKIHNNDKILLSDIKILGLIEKKTIKAILKNKFTDFDEIALLLNSNNILNKNKMWTKNAIKKICLNFF